MENKKFSFFAKEPIACPICNSKVIREEMLTGRGRFSAKELTNELRRIYEPIPTLGHITPIMYSITTCPECYISLFNTDWQQINKNEIEVQALADLTRERINKIETLFYKKLDFQNSKTQVEASASYYLAMLTYPYVSTKYSPSIKCSLAGIRLNWLVQDISSIQLYNKEYWEDIHGKINSKVFSYLDIAYANSLKQTEPFTFFGPDTDRNNGFEGLVYMHHYYKYLNLPKNNPIEMEKQLKEMKNNISRIFGIGKPSKNRPVAILEIVREFYNKLSEELMTINPHYIDEIE